MPTNPDELIDDVADRPKDWFRTGPSAMHDIVSAHKRRYALHLKGFDPEGRPRCLVLTWDGVWHPASPTTGNILKRASEFAPGERGKWNDIILTRADASLLMSSPAQCRWRTEDGGTKTLRVHEMLEVLP